MKDYPPFPQFSKEESVSVSLQVAWGSCTHEAKQELTSTTDPEMALTKNVWIIMNAASLVNSDASMTAPEMGPSISDTVSKMTGSKELATITRNGAAISKKGTSAGAASNMLSINLMSRRPSMVESEAKKAIGIVQSRQSVVVSPSENSCPSCKSLWVLPVLIQ